MTVNLVQRRGEFDVMSSQKNELPACRHKTSHPRNRRELTSHFVTIRFARMAVRQSEAVCRIARRYPRRLLRILAE